MKVVNHFAEPGIGMVQTRWTHLNRNYSFMTQVEAILLDGHFVLEHGGRSRALASSSTSTEPPEFGGAWPSPTAADGSTTPSPRTPTSAIACRWPGWKFKYLQDVECPAELPIEMTAFKTQQARWAKGLIQTRQEDPAPRAEERRAI